MRGRVRAGAGDDRRVVADRLERGAEEVEPLVVGERRALAGRAGDDDAVGAVLDEVPRQPLERVEVDRAVLAERRHDRGQDVAEHAHSTAGILAAMARFVLVHGAWHGGWCFAGSSRSWSARPRGRRRPTCRATRAARPRRRLRSGSSAPQPDAIVVGHSLGGADDRRTSKRVSRVYLAALAARRGRLRRRVRRAEFGGFVRDELGRSYWPDADIGARSACTRTARATQSDWAFAQLRAAGARIASVAAAVRARRRA